MAKELWRNIPDFPGYEVSNLGRIRSYWIAGRKTGISTLPQRIMAANVTILGHPQIRLMKDGEKANRMYVSHLVACTFIGPRPRNKEICHMDGDPTNNRVENLRYDTRENNHRDKIAHGTLYWGERHHWSTLTGNEVCQIREKFKAGSRNKTELAMEFGVTRSAIYHIVTGSTWKHADGPIQGIDY